MISGGWPRVVSGLKTLLETGDAEKPDRAAARSGSAAK